MYSRVMMAASLACLFAGPARAEQRVTLVGCVAPVEAAGAAQTPFVLKNATARAVSRRSGGSTSPKSSTPVGGGPAAARPSSSGASTAKGSTPIRATAAIDDSPGRPSSAKASVPIGRSGTRSTYALDAASTELSPLTGRTVEITGAVSVRSGSVAQTLKVEQVSVLSSDCAMQ